MWRSLCLVCKFRGTVAEMLAHADTCLACMAYPMGKRGLWSCLLPVGHEGLHDWQAAA